MNGILFCKSTKILQQVTQQQLVSIAFILLLQLICINNIKADATPVTYLKPIYNSSSADSITSGIDHWETCTCSTYTVVTSSSNQVTWNAGWYVVDDTVSLSHGAKCDSNVHLILKNNCYFTVQGTSSFAGIKVSGTNNSLTIYAQTTDVSLMGKLFVNGSLQAAGIGGGDRQPGQNITINGGKLNVSSGGRAAAIGGGFENSGKNITINGGHVTATGGGDAAAIGGGSRYNLSEGNGENITINGGIVIANGGNYGAGIGGGSGGDGRYIIINAGDVTSRGGVTGGAGIGGGCGGLGRYITINDGNIASYGGRYGAPDFVNASP